MFQSLGMTQGDQPSASTRRRSLRRHLLPRITTLAISAFAALVAQAIYAQPEIVRQLTALAASYVTDGRSTQGPRQAYVSEDWRQLDWLPNE